MITNEDVILAYRLLLGREPESVDVVNNLCQNVHDYEQLRESFLQSPEFLQKISASIGAQQNIRLRNPTLPRIPVEVDVTETQLAKMFSRIAQEWEALAKNDPYWSVLTQPQYRAGEYDNNRDQFFTSGKAAVDVFLATLRRNGINQNDLQSCLEVGCGVGRVSMYLAPVFSELIASDISEGHIKLAEQYTSKAGLDNVTFLHFSDLESIHSLPRVDSVFSIITLQHNPPPIMVWIFKKLLNSLNPKGVAYIQIPTYRSGYLFEVERYLHSPIEPTLEMHFLPQYEVFKCIQDSDCICLEVKEDGMVDENQQIQSNSFLIQKN